MKLPMFVAGLCTAEAFLPGHLTRELLWYIAVLGSFTSTIFLVMAVRAASRHAVRSGRLRAEANASEPASLPTVTVLKPVRGMEPRLEETLESFFRQVYPQYEIIFGARAADDEALPVIARLREKYPHVPVRVVIAGEPSWPNAKVFSLAKMVRLSDNSFLVISDSDVLVGPDFLRNLVPPLLQREVGLVTCLYRGVPAHDLWSGLEALGNSVEMPAGVMVAEMMEGMKFGLGAAMALRRDALDVIGGMHEAGQFYSDDFVVGKLIAEAGYQVVLSHYVVDHVLSTRSVRRTFGDQLRWMKSTRFSRPWGHVGSGLTYAVPFGALACVLAISSRQHLLLGMGLLGLAWLNRMLLAIVAGWGVLRDRRCLRLCWLYPVRDLLGFCTWVLSFAGNKFFWRGEAYQFGEQGRITPVERSIEFVRDGVTQAND